MKWVHFLHRDMSVLFDYFAQRAGVEYLAEVLRLHGFALTGRKIDHQEIYHDAQELSEFRARVKAGGQGYLEFIVQTCDAQCNSLVAVGKESRALPAMEAFDRYCLEQMKSMTFLPLFPGVIEPIITEQMDSIVRKYATAKIPSVRLAEILQRPSKPYVVTQEEIARYKLGATIQRDSALNDAFITSNEAAKTTLREQPELMSAILEHITQFGWIDTRHFKGDSWSLDDVLNKIRKILRKDCRGEYETAMAHLQHQEKNIEDVYTQLKFNNEDRRIVNTIRDFIYLRTQRKDAMSEATFHVQWAFDEIAQIAGLDAPSLIYLMPGEIKDAFNHPEKATEYKTEIAKRKKGFALITYDGVTSIFTDESTQPIAYSGNRDGKVYGVVTFPGEVNGLARKMMSKAEIGSLQHGEIVVTPTTSPDYVEIIDRMAGIITDEGGITCHVAQISREYQIPCITGTGNATQRISTGDQIYLNATKGFAEVKQNGR
jgi:phosphohistidine swiveling domain-containing protein